MTPSRPSPARMKPSSTVRPARHHPAARWRRGTAKNYVDGEPVTVLAERVEYLDENGKLVTESLRDFSRRPSASTSPASTISCSAGRRRSASRRSSKNWPQKGCCSIRCRRSRQGPRPLRPHLPHRLRPAAAHPPRACRERAQARCVHQVRPAGPRRARSPAGQISGRGRGHRPRRPKMLQIPPFTTHGHAGPTHQAVRRARRLRAAPSTNCKPRSIRKSPNPCPSEPPSNPFRTSCARTSASMAMPSASRQLCWMFFLKIIDDQDQELELLNDDYRSPIPKPCNGAPGRPTPRASPATRCSPSSTTSLFPQLKELPVSGHQRQPPPRGARRVRGRLQLHEVRPAHAAGDQQDQRRRFQRPGRAQALRRHLRATAQRPASAGNAGEYYTPRAVTAFMVDRIDPSPAKSCSTPPAAPAAFSPVPSATCASAM